MTVQIVVLILFLNSIEYIGAQSPITPVDEKSVVVHSTPEEIFKNNFIQRRMEQLSAVKNLQVTENAVDQYKMISIMAQKLFGTVQDTKEALDELGIFHGLNSLPKDLRELEVLTHFLENTALLCDFLIIIPEATKRLLSFNFRWRILLIDSIEFASSIKFIDDNTLKQFQVASTILSESQESKNFSSNQEGRNPKKKVERKKLKRGPRLSVGSSGGEL